MLLIRSMSSMCQEWKKEEGRRKKEEGRRKKEERSKDEEAEML